MTIPYKNVILFSKNLPPESVGGIETNAFYLIQYLQKRPNLEFSVVTMTKKKWHLRRRTRAKYKNIHFSKSTFHKSKFRDGNAVVKALNSIEYNPAETLIYHNGLDLHHSFQALKAEGYKQVARSGGNDLSYLQGPQSDSFISNLKSLNLLFLNSSYSLNVAREIGLPQGMLRVVKGGCEARSLVGSSLTGRLFPDRENIILSCGRLVDFKGFEDALHAIKILTEKGLAPYYVIVGNGPLELDLKNLAKALGIEDQCRFVGQVSPEEIWQYYLSADIYLSSSKEVTRVHNGLEYTHTETMGRSICEAQGFGLPVVVTNAGGSLDVVEVNKTGLVAEQGDREGIANRLMELISDGALRFGMAQNAKNYAAKELDWQVVASRYFEGL